MDDKPYIEQLEEQLQLATARATHWEHSFQKVITSIMLNMEERYILANQAFSYRKSLYNTLIDHGYKESEAQDFIMLEMAEAFLQERIKYQPTLRA